MGVFDALSEYPFRRKRKGKRRYWLGLALVSITAVEVADWPLKY